MQAVFCIIQGVLVQYDTSYPAFLVASVGSTRCRSRHEHLQFIVANNG